jgi:hypothetical protein
VVPVQLDQLTGALSVQLLCATTAHYTMLYNLCVCAVTRVVVEVV